MGDHEIVTGRLALMAAPIEFVQACVDRDYTTAGALLQITVPPTWPGNREAVDGLAVHLRSMRADPTEVPWRIRLVVLMPDRIAIGSINLKGPPRDGEVEIGWGILPSMRRMGFASEATTAMIGWTFDQPAVARISATIADDNAASIRVADKLGMKRTSDLRRGLPIYMLERPSPATA